MDCLTVEELPMDTTELLPERLVDGQLRTAGATTAATGVCLSLGHVTAGS